MDRIGSVRKKCQALYPTLAIREYVLTPTVKFPAAAHREPSEYRPEKPAFDHTAQVSSITGGREILRKIPRFNESTKSDMQSTFSQKHRCDKH